MSIVDSPADIAEAKLRLGAADQEQLENELGYWAVQEIDHNHEAAEAQARVWAAVELHKEAHAWVTLISLELRARRDEKRAKAGG